MSADRWRRIEELFEAALEQAPEERDAFLARSCGADDALHEEVRALLAADTDQPDFLDDLARRAGVGPNAHASLSLEEHRFTSAGSYRIVRELGRGGMGTVYLAERAGKQFQQEVALKVVKRGMDSDLVLQRFLRERQILARLQHPGIARFFDGGRTDGGQPYFAMEYVPGQPLTEFCDAHRLGVEARLQLFLEVCEALQYAHRNLVVHRDLKPSNILVTEPGETPSGGGRVKLLDFGIAKLLGEDEDPSTDTLTQTGMPLMTPEYAAPEQVRGEPVTTAADVYALGVILYELLSGHRPHLFAGRSREEIARALQDDDPLPPSAAVARGKGEREAGAHGPLTTDRLRRRLAGDLDTITLTALRKEPGRRYASAEALAEDVKRHLAGLPVLARKDSAAYRLQKFVRRNRLAVSALALVLLSLTAGLGLSVVQAKKARDERDRAQLERERAQLEARKAESAVEFLVRVFEVADPRETGGEVLTAHEILTQGSQLVESELAGQPEVQATLDDAIGRVYVGLGRLVEARHAFERSVSRWKEEVGPHHAEVALGMARLANVSRLEGDYAGAEPRFREVLALQRELHGTDHEDIASTLDQLGLLVLADGRAEEAVPLLEEALEMRRRVFWPEHRDVAVSLNNLAGAFASMQRHDEAIVLFREAIAIWREVIGPKHPDVAVAMNNIARILKIRGDLDEAEPLYREALSIWRDHYGDGHPNVSVILGNLAALLRLRGDLEAAEPVYREGLRVARETLGDGHWQVGVAINNLGKLLHDQHELEDAEASFREALAIWGAAHGEHQARVVIGRTNLASVLYDRGAHDEAATQFRRALEIAEGVYPEGHPRFAKAELGLGRLLLDEGSVEQADALLTRAHAGMQANYGPEDVRTAEAGRWLAIARLVLERTEEAATLLSASLRVFEREYGAEDERTLAVQEELEALR